MSGWNQDDDARVAASELSINQNQFRTPLLLIRLANAVVTVLPCPGGCLVGIVCLSASSLACLLNKDTRDEGGRCGAGAELCTFRVSISDSRLSGFIPGETREKFGTLNRAMEKTMIFFE